MYTNVGPRGERYRHAKHCVGVMCRDECVEHAYHETQHARLRLPVFDPQLHTIYLVLNTWAAQGTHTRTYKELYLPLPQ